MNDIGVCGQGIAGRGRIQAISRRRRWGVLPSFLWREIPTDGRFRRLQRGEWNRHNLVNRTGEGPMETWLEQRVLAFAHGFAQAQEDRPLLGPNGENPRDRKSV